jgi:hypothetical protein
MKIGRAAAAVAAAAFMAASCGISDPSNDRTNTFMGRIELGGSMVHAFSVSKNGGEINVKFTQILPDSGAALAVAYGTFASGSTTQCSYIRQGVGTQGRTVPELTNTIAKGDYCLVVFDSQLNTRAESYTVTVSHP